jgi:hypothetical protein
LLLQSCAGATDKVNEFLSLQSDPKEAMSIIPKNDRERLAIFNLEAPMLM